jgi:uncharacterized protein YPO0396
MKRLRKIRLINWYHFPHITMEIDGSCLLMGDNGSGKSTVLDAVQLALVGDLTEVRFNKAANEHSRRTLHGYVRYKIGSEDASRPGQVHFGRGGCTSYVILQIADSEQPESDFICGVVMEASEEDNNVDRNHFIIPRMDADAVPAVLDGSVVRTSKQFRSLLRDIPDARPYDVTTYRAEIRHRLGPLPEAFHRLLVKGLDFRPIGQVRQFVLDYLLDPRPLDTEALQSNLENYKQLEAKAREAEVRIAELNGICTQGEKILQEQLVAETHRFLSARAGVELAEEHFKKLDVDLAEARTQFDDVESSLSRSDAESITLNGERDRIVGLLHNKPAFQQIQQLERDLEATRVSLCRAQDDDAEARRILGLQTESLELLASEAARDMRRVRPELFKDDDLVGEVQPPEVIDRIRRTLMREGQLSGRDLKTWSRRLDASAQTLTLAKLLLDKVATDAREEGSALQGERKELESGKLRYPAGAEALLHLLRTKLKGQREPKPLCELIDVRQERWRNAVEGYLNTRRLDVLVAPEDFPRALSLYERHKKAYALPGVGMVFIHGVGLVDMEKILETVPRKASRSLAEQIQTEDELARSYCDFILGDVICCDDEQELRKHRRAITDTVMVYQNHTARQADPKAYSQHLIGQAARLRRMDEIDRRLSELVTILTDANRDISWLAKAIEHCRQSLGEVRRLPDLIDSAAEAAFLSQRAESLRVQLSGIDTSELATLEKERRSIDDQIRKTKENIVAFSQRRGELSTSIKQFQSQLAEATAKVQLAGAALEALRAEAESAKLAGWEQRYIEERRERGADDIRGIFERHHKGLETRISNLTEELVRLKVEYSNRYSFTAEVHGPGFAEFAAERQVWQESRLPEYRDKIGQSKRDAIQQLTEDIIFRLRESLCDVQRQIDMLNRALKEVSFGSDRYQFVLDVAREHKHFYDLVMEAGRFEKDSIFGANALADPNVKQTLEDLFNRLIERQAKEVKSELEAKADYREYFDYDLKIIHSDGRYSLYNKVAADKSGGETQTPFYIAMFASMCRLYRELAPGGQPRFGLLLLDEAFSKMDGQRIVATLRFARSLELQLILATPKERSELVAPEVENSLFIHKDGATGAPVVLDFSKEFKNHEPLTTRPESLAP